MLRQRKRERSVKEKTYRFCLVSNRLSINVRSDSCHSFCAFVGWMDGWLGFGWGSFTLIMSRYNWNYCEFLLIMGFVGGSRRHCDV